MKIEGSHALAGRKRNKRKNRSRRLLRDPLNPEVATRKGRERERDARVSSAYQGQGLLASDQFQKPGLGVKWSQVV